MAESQNKYAEQKKPKETIYYMSPFTWNSRKCKLTHINRKQMGVRQAELNEKGKGRNQERTGQKPFKVMDIFIILIMFSQVYTYFKTYHKTYHTVHFKCAFNCTLYLNKADFKKIKITCSQGQIKSHKSLDQHQADPSALLLFWCSWFSVEEHNPCVHLPSRMSNTRLLNDLFQSCCWVPWKHIYFVIHDTVFSHCSNWYKSRQAFP